MNCPFNSQFLDIYCSILTKFMSLKVLLSSLLTGINELFSFSSIKREEMSKKKNIYIYISLLTGLAAKKKFVSYNALVI